MTPDFGIRDVAKRWPVDIDDEVPSRACDDDDLVSTVLSDPVKRVDKFRVALCVHNARPAVTVELDNQHALGVPFQLQLAIGREIVRFSCLHGIVLSWSALCTVASRVPERSVASPLEIKSVVQWQISPVLVARRISDVKAEPLTDTPRTQFAHAFDQSPTAENGRFGALAAIGQRAIALRGVRIHEGTGDKPEILIRLLTLPADTGDRVSTP